MVARKAGRRKLSDRQRLRQEIVEMVEDQVAAGLASEATLRRTTMRMLGRESLPSVPALSPLEIAGVRERTGLSQAVLAGFLNVKAHTVSQWECGERRPSGPALKLLHLVRARGIDLLR